MTGPPRHPRTSRRRGFTLLELLIAIAMAGIVLLSLYSAMGTVFKARRVAMASTERARTVEVVMRVLQRDIEAAQSPDGVIANTFSGIDQTGPSGDTDTLEFYTTAPGPRSTDHTNVVNHVQWMLAADPNDAQQSVLVRQVSSQPLAFSEEDPLQEVLCRHVHSFNLRYFDGTDWVDGWDSTTEASLVPIAIEIDLDLDLPNSDGTVQDTMVRRVFRLTCVPPLTDDTAQQASAITGGLP